MRRREFIASISAIAVWPTAARAQQALASRRVGVLMGLVETDPFTIKYVQALHGALEKLGWTEGQNIQFIYRYAAGDPALARTYAKQLVELAPDLIVGHTTPVAAALSQATHAIPVVFVSITDPVRDGFVSWVWSKPIRSRRVYCWSGQDVFDSALCPMGRREAVRAG